ncbi:ATP-binding protein [Grimontia kaedaensis]|nr:ATP-binding protein [Grimontia kaedaensis]
MSLFVRLWLSFLITLGGILMLLYIAIQWSFDQGLIRYINQREAVVFQTLADNIKRFHELNGNLSLIEEETYYWRQLLESSKQGETLTDELMASWVMIMLFEPDKAHQPPPRKREFGSKPPPSHERKRGRPPHPQDHLRVSLLNEDRVPVKGPYKKDFSTLPITIDGTLIAYLAWPPSKVPEASYDVAFAESQKHAFLLLALVALLLGAIAALFLSRAFIRPVTQIASTTGEIVKGNYSARTKVYGKDEVAKLAADINTLAATLESAESARKEWLASTAHELRTPLSIIKGEFEAIIDGIRPANQKTLASIEEEIVHLQKLIEDLYELTNADIGAYRYKMSDLDISELVEEICQRRALQMQKLGLNLEWEVGYDAIWIDGDDTRIQQLIENLLRNSEKYTDSPGTVRLSLARKSNLVNLIVEDSAPGVPDESLPRLFEKLYRVESSRNREKGGSGLGLAIVQKIAEAHAGSIQASHSPLGGLRIIVNLPNAFNTGKEHG